MTQEASNRTLAESPATSIGISRHPGAAIGRLASSVGIHKIACWSTLVTQKSPVPGGLIGRADQVNSLTKADRLPESAAGTPGVRIRKEWRIDWVGSNE